MSDLWLTQATTLLTKGGLGTVLILGRSGKKYVDTLPRNAVDQVVLLEPDPKLALQLSQQYDDFIKVLPLAFSDRDGQSTLRNVTLSDYASLRPALGLQNLFPGLRETGTISVQTCSATSLLEQVALHDVKPNFLILSAAGEELIALSQLEEIGALDQFQLILTPLPAIPLYDGAADGETLKTRLEENGYFEFRHDLTDPDQPIVLFKRNAIWAAQQTKIDCLRQSLENEKAAREQLQSRLDDTQAQLETGQKIATERDKLRSDLKTARALAKKQTAQLSAEFKRLYGQINTLKSLFPVDDKS